MDQGQGVLVLTVGVDHGVEAADGLFDFVVFAFAQAFFFQIDELDRDLPFFKIAQGFFCIEALCRAEDCIFIELFSFRNRLGITAEQGQVFFLDVSKGLDGIIRRDMDGRCLAIGSVIQQVGQVVPQEIVVDAFEIRRFFIRQRAARYFS